VRVHREIRAQDDGYRSPLAPGLRASDDAARLADEIAFASGRLLALHTSPPDLFAEIHSLAIDGELERATWMCFLTVYLSPLQGDDPFAGIRLALAREGGGGGWDGQDGGDVPSLDGIPLGPRTSHDPGGGDETLRAYRHWAANAGGGAAGAGDQARAFIGEESWTPQRRFERAFERLALPGFGRMGRYELLVTLGRLGLYDMQADSLHLLTGGRGAAMDDLTTVAAKRVLAVGEPIYLERRALALAQELSVGIDVLDLAFANWGAGERATLGFRPDTLDRHAWERTRQALGL
jgi:Alpha-glutamyl/putrescinyl thymine pyrophosphorylase clade 3